MKFNLKIYLYLFLLFISTRIGAQNLVPNGGFEVFTGCPIQEGALDSAKFWLNPTYSISSTPDYFNACSPSLVSGVPVNALGYQNAFSGVAYTGIFLKQNGFPNPAREYIETELTQSLEKDSCYVIGFSINLPDQSKFSSTSFGVYLSNTVLLNQNNSSMFSLSPQVTIDPNTQLDTINWTTLTQKYIAQGDERYIVLGNFKDDIETVSKLANSSGTVDGIYVYVDSVFLLPCKYFYPIPSFLSSQATVCVNSSASYTDKSYNNPDQWQWIFEGGIPASYNGKQPPPIFYTDTGIFEVSLTTSNLYGSNAFLQQVHVVPGAEPVSVETSFQLKEGDIITLEVCARGSTYQWQPPVAILQNKDTLLTIQPDETQNYTCTVATVNGCTTNCQYEVKVQSGLLLPTGFTPNGDGVNDVFHILNTNITLNYFAVYNRWGQKLFETKNVEDGWDGIYEDIAQPIDTYVWQADYVITKTGKRKTAKGNVTLVR